jgi:VIT1/CCC1 family predicted Fe2+/Mn2+ transporter
VASQHDAEEADLERERRELEANPQEELEELTLIYEHRGLSPDLARQVAIELSDGDLLGAHARDELGFDELTRANPLQAAWTSAASFAVGASLPVIAVAIGGGTLRIVLTVVVALIALAVLGVVGALLGRAPARTAVLRVVGWGALAMVLTSGIGYLVGAAGV